MRADPIAYIGSAPYGVSRILHSQDRSFALAVFQRRKELHDSELNLVGQMLAQDAADVWAHLVGDGVITLPTTTDGGEPNRIYLLGGITAIVDGRALAVRGPSANTTTYLDMGNPPSTGTRTDLVGLELWYTEIQPTASPEDAATDVRRFGNVQHGEELTNDLINPDHTIESARRLQARYRLIDLPGRTTPQGYVVGGGFSYQPGDRVGSWTAGDGSAQAAQDVGSANGRRHFIPLATVLRTAGDTNIQASMVTIVARRLIAAANSDAVDDLSASTSKLANHLYALPESGRFPTNAFPIGSLTGAADAATVDGFSASDTPTADHAFVFDATETIPNELLYTGPGNGLNADQVDGAHASTTPSPNAAIILDGEAQIPNGALLMGPLSGLSVDLVDGFHAAASPTAGRLLMLGSGAKYTNSVLRTGSGQGLNVDQVDGKHLSEILRLDGSGRVANSLLYTGSGNGLGADTVDGFHAASFDLLSHTHGSNVIVAAASDAPATSILSDVDPLVWYTHYTSQTILNNSGGLAYVSGLAAVRGSFSDVVRNPPFTSSGAFTNEHRATLRKQDGTVIDQAVIQDRSSRFGTWTLLLFQALLNNNERLYLDIEQIVTSYSFDGPWSAGWDFVATDMMVSYLYIINRT